MFFICNNAHVKVFNVVIIPVYIDYLLKLSQQVDIMRFPRDTSQNHFIVSFIDHIIDYLMIFGSERSQPCLSVCLCVCLSVQYKSPKITFAILSGFFVS